MTPHIKHKDRPDHWVQPRPHRDASLRYMTHGPVQPMDYGRPGFAVRLAGFALSRLRRLNPFGRSSLARRRA